MNDPDVDAGAIYRVAQYLIVCTSTLAATSSTFLMPTLPPGFLGRQPNFHKFGLQCVSHEDPYVTTTSDELEVSGSGSNRKKVAYSSL